MRPILLHLTQDDFSLQGESAGPQCVKKMNANRRENKKNTFMKTLANASVRKYINVEKPTCVIIKNSRKNVSLLLVTSVNQIAASQVAVGLLDSATYLSPITEKRRNRC